jgi:hypothetical protein
MGKVSRHFLKNGLLPACDCPRPVIMSLYRVPKRNIKVSNFPLRLLHKRLGLGRVIWIPGCTGA